MSGTTIAASVFLGRNYFDIRIYVVYKSMLIIRIVKISFDIGIDTVKILFSSNLTQPNLNWKWKRKMRAVDKK